MCHAEQDSLWEIGSKPTAINGFVAPRPSNPLVPDPETEAGPSRSRSPSPSSHLASAVDDLEICIDGPAPTVAAQPLSPSEISSLLSTSLIQALSNFPTSLLPIPASQLYSNYVLPARPAYIPPQQRDEVVIGKSEWKKLTKWMKEVSKDGLVKIKESKGEVTITAYVLVSVHVSDAVQ